MEVYHLHLELLMLKQVSSYLKVLVKHIYVVGSGLKLYEINFLSRLESVNTRTLKLNCKSAFD